MFFYKNYKRNMPTYSVLHCSNRIQYQHFYFMLIKAVLFKKNYLIIPSH